MSKKFIFVDANGDKEESGGAFETADHINTSAGVGDAGKPIILDAAGKIDSTMIDFGAIDHGGLSGLGDDDHMIYTKADGTRAFTGTQSMGNFKLTSVATPTAANDAVNKAYADSLRTENGMKGNVDVATTGNITLTGEQTIDGTLTSASRVLVKNQTDPTENGIYVSAAGAWTRSEDMDNSPTAEIVNGVLIPRVQNSASGQDSQSFYISSVGTGVDSVHTIGVDDIDFDLYTTSTQLTPGDGIDISTNIVAVDLLASGGLKIVSTELAIEPADFAGTGLVDDGADNLAIDFSTLFNDQKAVAAQDINSTTNGEGASIVGIEDPSAYYTGTNVEVALDEIEAQIGGATSTTFNFTENNVLVDNDVIYTALNKLDLKFGDLASTNSSEGASLVGIEDSAGNYTATDVEAALAEVFELASVSTGETALAGTGGVSVGDLLYYNANDTVLPLNISAGNVCVGIALASASAGLTVKYARWDELVPGVLSSATAGTKFYWDGSALTSTAPSGTGQYVWQCGIAKNATDLLATVEFVKKNA